MTNYITPTLTAKELSLEVIEVVLLIDGLEKKTLKNEAKNAAVDVKFNERSFNLEASVTGPKGVITNYRQDIKCLPGEIIKEKCQVKIKKGQIILLLHKADTRSWAAKLAQDGLEQDTS